MGWIDDLEKELLNKSTPVEIAYPKLREPRNFSAEELDRVGVKLLDPDHLTLKCKRCRQVWSPTPRADGSHLRDWWKCPNGCARALAE